MGKKCLVKWLHDRDESLSVENTYMYCFHFIAVLCSNADHVILWGWPIFKEFIGEVITVVEYICDGCSSVQPWRHYLWPLWRTNRRRALQVRVSALCSMRNFFFYCGNSRYSDELDNLFDFFSSLWQLLSWIRYCLDREVSSISRLSIYYSCHKVYILGM